MAYSTKQWLDHVVDQNGTVIQKGTPLSAGNMNRMEEGIALSLYGGGALDAEAYAQLNALKKENDLLFKQRLQQSEVYLYNKYVQDGCRLNKMPNSRYLEICRTSTYLEGDVSKIYVDGKVVGMKDEQTAIMIPQNNGTSSKVFFIFIDYIDNKYKLNISEVEPNNKLILYRATVPAGDLRPDLNSVTLTDVRKINSNSYFRSTDPFCTVSLPGYAMMDTNYKVDVSIDDATDTSRVGDVIVYDKQRNGFKIKITGDADNVKLSWNIVETRLK
ncbi:MAG: hypothetical protein ACRCXT_11490 [Paraclostridium sp.]